MIRTVIVDDHVLIREGIRRALTRAEDMQVVGEAGSIAEARAWLRRDDLDVLVVDLRLPDGNGLDLVREQRRDKPHLGIVVLTMYTDDTHLLGAKDAGASRFVGKGAPSDELLAAVRAASRHPTEFVSYELQDALRRVSEDAAPALTSRETEVLNLLAEGLSVSGISRALFISDSTTKTHIGKIYTKLGVSNRAQAVMAALRLRLIPDPSSET